MRTTTTRLRTTLALAALAALQGGLAHAQEQAPAPAPAREQAPEPAQAQAPLPAQAFFAQPDMAQPLLSPSGRYVAVLVRGAQERNALAVVDLQEGAKSRVVAHFNDVDIGQARWVGDQRLVYSVVDLMAGSGDRRLAPGLFVVERDGSGQRELVKLRPNPVISDGREARDRRLDFNHTLLYVPQNGEEEIVVGEQLGGGDNRVREVLPLLLNVKTRAVRRPWTNLPRGALQWLFDPSGEPRVAVTVDGPRTAYHWRAPGQDAWQVIGEGLRTGTSWQPHAVDGKGQLVVRVHSGAGGTGVLARFDFATGKPERQALVSTPGFDFQGSLVVDPESGRTLGVRALVESEETVWLDAEMKAVQADVDQRLPGRVNRLSCAPCSGAQRALLIESHADRDPGTFLVWRPGAARPEVLGRALKVPVARMASVSLARIKARDGRDLPVWVTLPADAGPARPAVVLVHGGPWLRGGSWRWHPMQQFLASRGYVVIEPEFRGSTGYGAAHFRAGWKQWGQAMQDDVADALTWAVGKGLADPARVCIAGSSYGGYATLMGLVRHPDLYRCGAAWLAVTDLMRLVEGSYWTRDDTSDDARQYTLPVMVGDAKADRAMLLAHSPLEQAARIRAPVLLAYGDEDLRVPLVHGKDMRSALTKAGNEPEWIVYPEEGHGWRKLANRVDFAQRLEAFLARHLK